MAKSVLADKFWIVEKDGQKVGTIRSNDAGVTLTMGVQKLAFKQMEELQQKVNVDFSDKQLPSNAKVEHTVNDYPCKTEPYNGIFDLKRKLPLYTKTENSQSFFCAGYYCIEFENGWVPAFCPKLITLTRNTYLGPFTTKLEMNELLRKQNDGS